MIPLSLAFTLAMLSLNVALYLALKSFTAPFYMGTQKNKKRVLYAGFLLSLLGVLTGFLGPLSYPDVKIGGIEFVVIISMLLLTILLFALAVQNFKTLARQWKAAPADKADLKHPMAVYFAPSFLELVANKTRSTVSKNLKAWGQETVAAVEAAGGYDQGGKTCCAYFVPDYSDEGFRLELLDVEKPFFLNNSPLKREGFDLAEAFLLGGSPRFAVTSTTKSFLTQPLYGEGRNPPPSEPPELALSDPFSGLNDYDTGVKPGCYSG